MENPDWMEYEIRIRKLIKELVEPTVRRTHENKVSLERLHQKIDTQSRSLSDHDMLIRSCQNKLSEVDELGKRVLKFTGQLHTMDARIESAKEQAFSSVDLLAKDTISLSEEFKNLESQREALRDEINDVHTAFTAFKGEMEEKFNAEKSANNSSFAELYSKAQSHKGKLKSQNTQLSGLGKFMQQADFLLKKHDLSIESNKKEAEEHKSQFLEFRDFTRKTVESNRNMCAHTSTNIQNELKNLYVFAHNELPVDIQLNLAKDSWKIITDPRIRRTYALCLSEKYSSWDDLDLTDQLHETLEEAKAFAQEVVDTPIPPKEPETKHSRDNSEDRNFRKEKESDREKDKHKSRTRKYKKKEGKEERKRSEKRSVINKVAQAIQERRSIEDHPNDEPPQKIQEFNKIEEDKTEQNAPQEEIKPEYSIQIEPETLAEETMNENPKETIHEHIKEITEEISKEISNESSEKISEKGKDLSQGDTHVVAEDSRNYEEKPSPQDSKESLPPFKDFTPEIEELRQELQKYISQIEPFHSSITDLSSQIKALSEHSDQVTSAQAEKIEALSSILSQSSEKTTSIISEKENRTEKAISNLSGTIKSSVSFLESKLSLLQTELNNKNKELDLLVKQAFEEFKMTSNHRKREQSDTFTEMGKLQYKIEEIKNMQELLTDSFNKIQSSNDALAQFAHMSLAMYEQEEIDRGNIVLAGQKETSRTELHRKSPIISIDKPAVLKNQVMSSFKMACLAYNPSPVKIRNSLYSRKEVLDIQKRLIDQIGCQSDFSALFEIARMKRPKSSTKQYRTVSLPSSHRVYQKIVSEREIAQRNLEKYS